MQDDQRLTVKNIGRYTQIKDGYSTFDCLRRLAELEDKIENGTLIEVEPPCIEEELGPKSDYICKHYKNDSCHLNEELFGAPPQLCHHINDFENCMGSKPIEYEKESSPYRLNNTEVNVLSKLFKDYIKDENKLEKLVENFRSYLSNASKSPANAEGKCSDEDTLYRIMKERIEDEKEQKSIWGVKNGDTGLVHTTCERLIFVDHEIGKALELSPDKLSEFDWININGIKFKREK